MTAIEDHPVADLMRAFDTAFMAGDADGFAALFTEDGQMLLLHSDAMVGRPAIAERWKVFFGRHDTSAWDARTDLLEVHGDRAYILRTYQETLVPRGEGPRVLVRGRLVAFLRHDADDGWRIGMLMNSHSRPPEELA